MALVPNAEQQRLITQYGYDYHYWLVEFEDETCIVIIHKTSKDTHTLKK